MLSYMAPSVSDKPPTVPSRLALEHKSATAYHRFSRPASGVGFNVQQLDGQQSREGFGALPAPPVRRTMVKEDSSGSITSSIITDAVLPATHESKRPATKPAASKRSVSFVLSLSLVLRFTVTVFFFFYCQLAVQ
ncbi:Uncharacterized protein FWK35_00039040 [Aphis craccivora]|uniref:Uncharacterized protein n=1 Tax=Aphis craccivora TaxID=307492 RepID=A0A6G0YDU4_APHCR|nr:Uncharacterized protein FWK35_00039040 [Aphis craccivora]